MRGNNGHGFKAGTNYSFGLQHWGRDAIEPHLATVMPGLIKVRKVNKILKNLYLTYLIILFFFFFYYRLTTTLRARFARARSSAW